MLKDNKLMKPECKTKINFPAWGTCLIFFMIVLLIEDIHDIVMVNQTIAGLEGYSVSYITGFLVGITIKPIAHGGLAFFLHTNKRFD